MLTTRLATPADHAHYARLFRELGVPEAPLDAGRFAAEVLPRAIVALDGDRIVGYATWRLYGDVAHVPNVVTAPEARRRGVGRALMEALRAAVTADGCVRWYLNVKRDNGPAVRLYERSGMAIEHESLAARLPWELVAALPAPPGPVAAFTPTAADDAAIAARCGVSLGQRSRAELARPGAAGPGRAAAGGGGEAAGSVSLGPSSERSEARSDRGVLERVTSQRTRAGYVPLALREAGAVAGFATFSPSHPGAYPFWVARPDLARPLLEALRPHARVEHDFLYVTVEGDPPLARALLDAGATVLFELYQMGAALG